MVFERLSSRLALWMVLATVFMQALHAGYRLSVDVPKAKVQGIEDISRVIHSLRPAFSESLFQYNDGLSEQLLKTFSSYPAIHSVDLLDDDGRVVHHWSSASLAPNVHPFMISSELEYGSKNIGLLNVSLNLAPIILKAETEIKQHILFSTIMGFMSLILLYFIAQNQVTLPISKLSDMVSRIDTNKLEVVEIEKLDEIPALAEVEVLRLSLKTILTELADNLADNKKSHDLLQEFAAHMEDKVRLRTDELAISKEKAERANQAKSDFMNTMTHELRTPLNSIMGFSSILKGQELPDRLARLVDNVHASGDQLLRLVTDIIDYVDLETKPLKVQMLSIFDVVNSVFVEYEKSAEARSLTFIKTVDEALVVKGDPKRLGMALRHLVSNAIKFTEQGSVEIEAKKNNAGEVCIVIRDTGPGIDLERIQNLSESFVQQEQGLNRTKEGVGLGLAIAERVCKKWGAELSFSHATPQGTIVTLELPDINLPE